MNKKLLTYLPILLLAGAVLGFSKCAEAQAWDCLPSNYLGEGTELKSNFDDVAGDWYVWACPKYDSTGRIKWVPQSHVVLKEVKSKPQVPMQQLVRSVVAASSPVDAANELRKRFAMSPNTTNELTQFNLLHKRARQWQANNLPRTSADLPGNWYVARNGSSLTRPWFEFDQAKRVPKGVGGTVTTGPETNCYPYSGGVVLKEGGKDVAYLPFGKTSKEASPSKVTVCNKW